MSSGNRKKTFVAMSLIGNSKVFFFDDATSRLDPQGRQSFFKIIKDLTKNNESSVLITTHSFEDAEFISNRIGFLSAGQLKCLGSPAHLKNKFF